MANRIASKVLLPSQFHSIKYKGMLDNSREILKNYLNGKEITIETEDKLKLNGMLFSKNQGFTNLLKKRELLIYFNGMNMSYELFAGNMSNIKKLQNLGFDVLVFNYRGVVKSKGSVKVPDDLIEDGKSVLNYAKKSLKVKEKDTYVLGHSLGGGIATKTIAKSKSRVNFINDRSFSSLKKAIDSLNIFFLFKSFLKALLNLTSWNLDPENDWSNVKGKKCLIYASDDELIKEKGSLYHSVKNDISSKQVQRLEPGMGHNRFLTVSQLKRAIRSLA